LRPRVQQPQRHELVIDGHLGQVRCGPRPRRSRRRSSGRRWRRSCSHGPWRTPGPGPTARRHVTTRSPSATRGWASAGRSRFSLRSPRAGPATGGPLRASGGNRPGPCLPNRPPPSASPVRRPPARRRRRSSPIAVRIESDNTATTPCLLTSSTPSGRRGGHRFELDRTFLGRSAAVVRGQDARQSEATPNPQWPAARQSVRPGASPTPPGPPWHQ